jgi:hypothetical protein
VVVRGVEYWKGARKREGGMFSSCRIFQVKVKQVHWQVKDD